MPSTDRETVKLIEMRRQRWKFLSPSFLRIFRPFAEKEDLLGRFIGISRTRNILTLFESSYKLNESLSISKKQLN